MSKAKRLLLPGAVAAALLALPAIAPAQQGVPPPAPDEKPEDLPEGKGREETFYACVVCHGSALVRQQGQTAEQWDQTIAWMIEKQGMPPPDTADRKLIVEYLATAFPPRRKGRPNPFLQN